MQNQAICQSCQLQPPDANKVATCTALPLALTCLLLPHRYTADFDLKKVVGDSSLAKEARIDTRKELKKVFEDKYKNQTGKNEKKASGTQYFFKRLRF
jgi:hypothetical protein